jgi:hypothetical protein
MTWTRDELVTALHDAKRCIERALEAADIQAPEMASQQLRSTIEEAEGKLSQAFDLIPHHIQDLKDRLQE